MSKKKFTSESEAVKNWVRTRNLSCCWVFLSSTGNMRLSMQRGKIKIMSEEIFTEKQVDEMTFPSYQHLLVGMYRRLKDEETK